MTIGIKQPVVPFNSLCKQTVTKNKCPGHRTGCHPVKTIKLERQTNYLCRHGYQAEKERKK